MGLFWHIYCRIQDRILDCCGTSFEETIGSEENNNDIRAVAWTLTFPSNDILAIGAGESVYIYNPYSLVPSTASANSIPEMPLAWRQVRTLLHTSRVHAVVWTESGDGLLTTGDHVD